MNILVGISKAPDTTAKISFTEGNTKLDTNGVQFIINPYDEWYALVRALELKEAVGGKVTLINVGRIDNDQVIRKGLAVGADEAIRVDNDPLDAYTVALEIAHYAKAGNFDLVFLGKETIDYNGSEVGAMVAELLDWPFMSYANHLEMENGKAKVSCEIEGGTAVYEVDAPFVLSAAKGLAEQRIPNMRGIMMAKSKPLEVVAPQSGDPLIVVSEYTLPAEKTSVKLVDADDMDELVRLLKEEAKVI
jgi:electron transfer flavoprotein beta subunit